MAWRPTISSDTSPQTLIVQPCLGIGDMIWHLQYIRAIVRDTNCGPVHLITQTRTAAKNWLQVEPSIAKIEYIDRRKIFKVGLRLRPLKLTSAWIMHSSLSYACIARVAGIRQIYGLGGGLQKFLISNQPLDKSLYDQFQLHQMDALMQQHHITVNPEDQVIKLDDQAIHYVQQHYGHYSGPHVCFGIGASEDYRTWPPEYFIQLAIQMNKLQPTSFFICGAQAEQLSVQHITSTLLSENIQAIAIDHLNLTQVFALIGQSQLFIGNDSSLLNAAACLAVPSVGIFGSSPILTYSRYIHGIRPDGPLICGDKQGMLDIKPQRIMHYLQHHNLFQINGKLY